ncbi:MAG TPA: bifunctional diguanylate cyclase/phosphodiesterase, partial [Micavibrio sp.]
TNDYPASGSSLHKLVNPQDVPRRLAAIHALTNAALNAGSPQDFSIEYRLRRVNGAQVDIHESGNLRQDSESGNRILCGVMRIAAQNRAQDALSMPLNNPFSYASYDTSMTHYGRLMICQKIQEWGQVTDDRHNMIGYLLVIGIDRLSLFNEAFGAQFTDEIIEKTGKRLRQMAREGGVTARIDGDVFALFFHQAPHAEMAAVAHHLLKSFYETPLQTSRGPIGVGISIGGVLIHRQCKSPANMLTKAEMAMQSAKDRGRGRFVSYNEAAGEARNTRLLLESGDAFLCALKDGRVRLAFQPVVNSKTNDVSFHESLIRFIDEQGRIHSAGDFIPAIEKLGLTRLVDRYALRLAIQELSMSSNLELSVNVSNLTLSDPDWLRGVVAALRDRPQLAGRLIIEITESAAMFDIAKTIRIVKTLRDLGCRVALDDFGTGYTAFSQLRDMDISLIKIDKSFVRHIAESENRLFVKTLQTLADGMHIETVGEGAETMTEARLLASDGINHIQGYAFGFPSVERVWLPKDHKHRKFVFSPDERKGSDDLIAGELIGMIRN